ncbi:MAG TPA: metallophosphoesterase [Methylocella sp.]|nr:metallophosphoesterase [Methylocella sp.]
MADEETNDAISRRGALECMIWAGTGVLWTLAGGVPHSSQLLGAGAAQASQKKPSGFSFVQISDSHIGFNKPANPDPAGTLKEAIVKIAALPKNPSFMIHTGDITHLSKPGEFDDAQQIIGSAKLDVHYVPGEHDIIDADNGKAYLDRFGKSTKGSGWYSFDDSGVHFIGLVNVANLKAGGLGSLGDEQLAWLAEDLRNKPTSMPIVVFAHIPLWTISAEWGWGTEDAEKALALLKKFGSVTMLNGHIHQVMQKVEGNMIFHTARSTAFPQPAPGTAPSPGPMLVPAEKLRGVLGIASVEVRHGKQPLAIIDTPLA